MLAGKNPWHKKCRMSACDTHTAVQKETHQQ
jgi:hypothetical protein